MRYLRLSFILLLGGARQRVTKTEIPLGTMNPTVTKLDGVSIPSNKINKKIKTEKSKDKNKDEDKDE